MTNRAALLRLSGFLVFFAYASPACTDDESVAASPTGGSANRSGGGAVSDAGALSSSGGELSQGGIAGANTGVPEGGAAGSPYPPEPGGAAGMPFGDGGTTGAGQSSTQAGKSSTGGRKPEGHSPQGGAPGGGECGEFRGASGAIGAGGANGQLAPALEGTYCECDGPWNVCHIEPEQFCYGPPELGCNPTLEKMRAVLSDSCARGTYSECPAHQVLVQLEYHSPIELEFQFDDRTGTLTSASAFPVEPDCNADNAQAYYLVRSAGRADTADCRNCYFGYGDVDGACSFSEAGGAPGESQGGQAGVD